MSLKGLVDKKKAFQTEMRKALTEELKAFFDSNPNIDAIRWHQYTPYFNDGDQCVFRVRDVEIQAIVLFGDDFYDEYSIDKPHKEIKIAVHELNSTFKEIEDILEMIFGDHVEITIDKKLNVTVEEYSHE